MPQKGTARVRSGILAATAALMILSGCAAAQPGPDSSASATPVSGGDITIARLGSPVNSLDPDAETLLSNNAYTLDKIFDTLVTQSPTGDIEPSLATEWSVSADNLTWTFDLRSGVHFSNGNPLTSADVVYSIKRHLSVVGALPLSAPIVDVVADGDGKVVITLSAPYSPLLTELATFASSIVPADLDGLSAEVFFDNPVGTGPFELASWDKSTGTVKLVRNPQYWQAGKPYLDSVTFTIASDDNSLVQQLLGGQVQIADSIPIANVASLKSNPAVSVDSVSSWNQDEVFFNTSDGPFASKDLRQAVVHAIDRASLVAATTFGTGTVGTTYIPATVRYSKQDTKVLGYDLAAAKASFAASGVPAGTTVKLLVEAGSQARDQQAQIIQSSLAQIGLTVDIVSQDSATFWTTFPSKDYEFALSTVIADTSDPDNITFWQVDSTSGSDSFHTGYQNDEVDRLAAEGRATPDGDARAAIYAQIQQIVADDSPSLTLDYTSYIAATQATVHGLVLIPNGTMQLQDVWIQH